MFVHFNKRYLASLEQDSALRVLTLELAKNNSSDISDAKICVSGSNDEGLKEIIDNILSDLSIRFDEQYGRRVDAVMAFHSANGALPEGVSHEKGFENICLNLRMTLQAAQVLGIDYNYKHVSKSYLDYGEACGVIDNVDFLYTPVGGHDHRVEDRRWELPDDNCAGLSFQGKH